MIKLKIAYIGVDPGKSGFFTVFADGKYLFYSMPTHKVPTGELTKKGKPAMKTVFHEGGFREFTFQIKKDFPNHKFYAGLEQVTGRHGWSAENNFSFGHTAGLQKMVLIMLDAEITMVRPQKWQSVMYQGYQKFMIPSSTGKTMVHDTKATSAFVAWSTAPHLDFRKNEGKGEAFDDNKTDSFLICVYLMRQKQNEIL